MATVSCPVCSGELKVLEDDYRSEWERITYLCGKCDVEYTRLITFQTQSRMVASDEWEDLEPEVSSICMHYNGEHPLVDILEVEKGTDPMSVIAGHLIEEHDWEIEDITVAVEQLTFFYLDPDVVERLKDIEWPQELYELDTVLVQEEPLRTCIKLSVYKAFEEK